MYKHLAWIWPLVGRAVVIGVLFAVSFALLSRMHGVKQAMRYAEVVRPQIQADARFAHVQCGGGGGQTDGCLWVVGSVASEQDFAALQALVAATHPPVPPLYQVQIGASPTFTYKPNLLSKRLHERFNHCS